MERARAYAKRIPTSLAIIDKRRVGNEDRTETLHVIGDVKGKDCVLVDDIIDTAGSLASAAAALKDAGAKDIYAAASHAVFSGPAMDRIEQSALKEVFVTDTIPLPMEKNSPKVTQLTVSKILGEAIRRVVGGDSVSSLFV